MRQCLLITTLLFLLPLTAHAANYTFTGQEQDASGLMYYGSRYYDPQMARFTQLDTVNTFIMTGNPQNLNSYSYVSNNPVNRVDSTGHLSQLINFDADQAEQRQWNLADVTTQSAHDVSWNYYPSTITDITGVTGSYGMNDLYIGEQYMTGTGNVSFSPMSETGMYSTGVNTVLANHSFFDPNGVLTASAGQSYIQRARIEIRNFIFGDPNSHVQSIEPPIVGNPVKGMGGMMGIKRINFFSEELSRLSGESIYFEEVAIKDIILSHGLRNDSFLRVTQVADQVKLAGGFDRRLAIAVLQDAKGNIALTRHGISDNILKDIGLDHGGGMHRAIFMELMGETTIPAYKYLLPPGMPTPMKFQQNLRLSDLDIEKWRPLIQHVYKNAPGL